MALDMSKYAKDVTVLVEKLLPIIVREFIVQTKV